MQIITALLSGLLFGFGLILAGMTDPARILAFLDVAGDWNPSLALVMAGAIAVAAPAFAWVRNSNRTLLGAAVKLPERWPVTAPLIGGAALFGLGWGLCGVCPGPALVLLGQDGLSALLLVAAIIVGSRGGEWLAAKFVVAPVPAGE